MRGKDRRDKVRNMSKEKKEEPSKKNKEKEKKLSFAQTVKNDLYAMKLAASIDTRLFIAGFLLMLF